MMQLPSVAIIGRPNVGKSTLFNALIGRRRSIVSDIAGTTRDQVVERMEYEKGAYWLVDTAGLTGDEGTNLEMEMQAQAHIAAQNADVLIFVLDAKKPLTQDDYDVATMLRKAKKPVIVAANKIDDGDETRAYDLAELGFGLPMAVSGKNFVHTWELQAAVEKELPEMTDMPDMPDGLKIALVGRPNVGKSTLMNAFVGKERAIVSDQAGTTRDSLYLPYTAEDGTPYVFIDTAGVRKPGKLGREIEYWSTVRTRQAIEDADVCAVLIDAMDGVTHQDMALIGTIVEAGKGLVLCVNKFDLSVQLSRQKDDAPEEDMAEVAMWGKDITAIKRDFLFYLQKRLAFCTWAPVVFFSGLTGKGILQLLPTVDQVNEERNRRVSTADLNRFLPDITYGHVMPSVGTKQGKLKYLSQVDVAPPVFLFSVNNTQAFHWSYKRYCENKLREKYGFAGTPIELKFKDSMDKAPKMHGRVKRRSVD